MSDRLRRALVLTAGRGERLHPLSRTRAKPAVPIAGEALVCRVLRWLAGAGVTGAVLNLHHRPETIAREVGDGAAFGIPVRYSWEQPLLGSAGGPRRALPILDADRFFIVNGDTLTDVDLDALASAHARSGALVTMALVPNPRPDAYGGVRLGGGERVEGFTRPGEDAAAFHFVGVQIAERSVFLQVPDGERSESVNGLYREMIARSPGSVRGFACAASFRDVGTPADYLATSLAVAAAEGLPALPVPASARVHPTARLVRTAVWEGAEVGAGAVLRDCVVGDGARVPAGSVFAGVAMVPAASGEPRAGDRVTDGLLVTPLDLGRLEVTAAPDA